MHLSSLERAPAALHRNRILRPPATTPRRPPAPGVAISAAAAAPAACRITGLGQFEEAALDVHRRLGRHVSAGGGLLGQFYSPVDGEAQAAHGSKVTLGALCWAVRWHMLLFFRLARSAHTMGRGPMGVSPAAFLQLPASAHWRCLVLPARLPDCLQVRAATLTTSTY